MLAGTLASHYRVESQLGVGGMGVVYEATDTRLGRRVAVKVLHDESLSDPSMLARLEREARLLAP
jgi:serine/threonine protein kinase